MTEQPEEPERAIYVRCRDGAYYKNPMVVFREGFLTFVDDHGFARADLVLWVVAPPVVAREVAARVLGDGIGFMRNTRRVERVVPFTKPWEYRQADVTSVVLERRIPRPKHHEGMERYVGRLTRGALLVELVSNPLDAKEIEVA